MKKTIHISESLKIVFTKNEHGFQEVLDDLPHAKTFDVITFNISSKESALLKTVRRSAPKARFRMVTNIPNRYDGYRSAEAANKARTQIRSYLKQLNPTSYVAEMSAFFNYDTHCKVIATENVAYMGSGNFSDESARNFELGLIIRDKTIIKDLVDMVFADVTEQAYEHQGNLISTAIIQLNAVAARLRTLKADYDDLFYSETDEYASPNFKYFEWQDVRATEADLDALSNLLDELESILGEMEDDEHQEPIASSFNRAHIDTIRDRLVPDAPVFNFITHNSDSFMQDWIGEQAWGDEEEFDEVTDQAGNEDLNRRSDLADKAKPEVYAMLSNIDTVLAEIQKATDSLKKLNVKNKHIDNT